MTPEELRERRERFADEITWPRNNYGFTEGIQPGAIWAPKGLRAGGFAATIVDMYCGGDRVVLRRENGADSDIARVRLRQRYRLIDFGLLGPTADTL